MNEISTQNLITLSLTPLFVLLAGQVALLNLVAETADTLEHCIDIWEGAPMASIHPIKPSSKPVKIIRK